MTRAFIQSPRNSIRLEMVVADDPLEAFGCLVGTGSQSVGHVAPKMEWGDLAAREALLPV
ncbi:MAG: hypothetical protein V3V11_07365 [Vicinamibacteria bacterium]